MKNRITSPVTFLAVLGLSSALNANEEKPLRSYRMESDEIRAMIKSADKNIKIVKTSSLGSSDRDRLATAKYEISHKPGTRTKVMGAIARNAEKFFEGSGARVNIDTGGDGTGPGLDSLRSFNLYYVNGSKRGFLLAQSTALTESRSVLFIVWHEHEMTEEEKAKHKIKKVILAPHGGADPAAATDSKAE